MARALSPGRGITGVLRIRVRVRGTFPPPPKESIPASDDTRTTLGAKVVSGGEDAFSFELKSR